MITPNIFSISFSTGRGIIAIMADVKVHNIVRFAYKQINGTMYHNHPLRVTEGLNELHDDIMAALKSGPVWFTDPPDYDEWVPAIMGAAHSVWDLREETLAAEASSV